MENELWANMYLQEHCTIYGHGVWHYLVDTAIGQIHIVQYEGRMMELQEQVIFNNNDKAEKVFQKFCKDLLSGKAL